MNIPPDHTLAALRREFPGYQVWLEPSRGRYRFVAVRLHPGTGPHTVITDDPTELRAALAPLRRHEPSPAAPPRGGSPDTPLDIQVGNSVELRSAASRPA